MSPQNSSSEIIVPTSNNLQAKLPVTTVPSSSTSGSDVGILPDDGFLSLEPESVSSNHVTTTKSLEPDSEFMNFDSPFETPKKDRSISPPSDDPFSALRSDNLFQTEAPEKKSPRPTPLGKKELPDPIFGEKPVTPLPKIELQSDVPKRPVPGTGKTTLVSPKKNDPMQAVVLRKSLLTTWLLTVAPPEIRKTYRVSDR